MAWRGLRWCMTLRASPELTLRQGMANGARFTTPELSDLDRRIAEAGERASARERTVFAELVQNTLGALVQRNQEPGDKFFDYRGIPNMFLHVFTRRELKADLLAAGFRIVEFIALDTERRHALRRPWLFGRLRANGWIVVCARD